MRRAGSLAMAITALVAVVVLVDPVAARAAEGGTLRLASQTAWVTEGQQFVLRLQVAGVPQPDQVDLRVTIHQRVTSRSQFTRTLDDQSLGPVLRTTSSRLDQLPLDAGLAVTVILGPPGLTLTRTGVYPVEVQLRDSSDGGVLDKLVTHLVFVGGQTTGPRLGVAWVVPIHAPPATRQPGPLATLADVLQSPAYRGLPLVLAPTPETLDELATGSGGAGRDALAAVRAGARGRQVVARPYVPVDTGALLADGLGDEVANQLSRGVDTVSDLLGSRPDTRTWVGEERLDDTTLAQLRDLQVDRVVVPEADLTPVRLQLTLAQPFELEGRPGRLLDAVMADAGLSAHFVNGGDQVLAAHQLLADLAVLWLDSPQKERAVVALPPRRWAPSRAFLDAALSGLAQSPVLTAMSLDTVFATIQPATTGRRTPMVRQLDPGPHPTLGVPAASLARLRTSIDDYGSILPPGSPLYDGLDRALLTTESADLTARRRQEAVAGLRSQLARRIDQLVVPRPRTITLTAREGEIPLTFMNTTGTPVNVLVRLTSDKLEFPDAGQRRTVEEPLALPPRSKTVRYRVKARAAGDFPMTVSLLSPRGDLVLATTRFKVRSTAASGVGIGLSVGAGLFLLVWWGRHLARARRARRPAA
jgi:Family of unknown function (DUF6049)